MSCFLLFFVLPVVLGLPLSDNTGREGTLELLKDAQTMLALAENQTAELKQKVQELENMLKALQKQKIIEKIREHLKKWAQSGNQSETTSTAFSCPSNIDDFAACDATSNPVGCYCIVNESGTREEAVDWCEEIGAKLVSIETQAESLALKTLYSTEDNFDMNGGTGLHLWTSGSDQEGEWVWTSTNQTITEFTDWRPEEPSQDEDVLYIDLWLSSNYSGWNSSPNDPNEFGWEVFPLCEF